MMLLLAEFDGGVEVGSGSKKVVESCWTQLCIPWAHFTHWASRGPSAMGLLQKGQVLQTCQGAKQ